MGISRALGVVVILFLGVLVALCFLLLLVSLAIMKEREFVQVVFEGDKLIQVITSLSSFHLLVAFNCFYLFVLV